MARAFAKFDRDSTSEIATVHKGEKAFVYEIRRGISEMEDQFKDRTSGDPSVDGAWDSSRLREKGVRS